MNIKNLLLSPIEQFEVLPLILLQVGTREIAITNQTITLIMIFTGALCLRRSLLNPTDWSNYMIPFRLQFILEKYIISIRLLCFERIGKHYGNAYFPLILSLSFYMFWLNLSGMVPHTGAMLAHPIVVLTISSCFCMGMNLMCIRRFGIKFVTLMLPPNTSPYIALILLPVEALSFFCRPLSLATRVFANAIGGHTLVKITIGCLWSLSNLGTSGWCIQTAGFIIAVPMMALETGVALIQSSVFITLVCIYIGECLSL